MTLISATTHWMFTFPLGPLSALTNSYGDWALPEAFRNQPGLTKPFTARELKTQVLSLHSGQVGY